MFMAAFPPAFFGFMTGITTIVTAPFQFLNIPIYNFIKKNPGLDENLYFKIYFFLLFYLWFYPINWNWFCNNELYICWAQFTILITGSCFLFHTQQKPSFKSPSVSIINYEYKQATSVFHALNFSIGEFLPVLNSKKVR